jgi:uracil-DNA glycosylase family 4
MILDDRSAYLEALGFSDFPWGNPVNGTNQSMSLSDGVLAPQLLFLAEQQSDHSSPFVGEAGELFEKMVQAMGLQNGDYKVAGICFQGKDEEAHRLEILELLKNSKAKIVVSMGDRAAAALISPSASVPELRSRFHFVNEEAFPDLKQFLVLATFHPAYLLKEAAMKRAAWDDLQLVMKKLKET